MTDATPADPGTDMVETDKGFVRMPRYTDINLSDEEVAEAAENWPHSSPAQQVHSMKMRKLNKLKHSMKRPDGTRLFGGVQAGSGQPRSRRVGQSVLEEAEKRHKEIADAIFAPLAQGSGATAMERHKAGMNITKLAREEVDLEMREDAFARKTNDEIIRAGEDVVFEMIKRGQIDLDGIRQRVEEDEAKSSAVDSVAEEISG